MYGFSDLSISRWPTHEELGFSFLFKLSRTVTSFKLHFGISKVTFSPSTGVFISGYWITEKSVFVRHSLIENTGIAGLVLSKPHKKKQFEGWLPLISHCLRILFLSNICSRQAWLVSETGNQHSSEIRAYFTLLFFIAVFGEKYMYGLFTIAQFCKLNCE